MADNSFNYALQFFWESSSWIKQLRHTGTCQLPLSVMQAPPEIHKQVLKRGLSFAAEGMHGCFHRDTPGLSGFSWANSCSTTQLTRPWSVLHLRHRAKGCWNRFLFWLYKHISSISTYQLYFMFCLTYLQKTVKTEWYVCLKIFYEPLNKFYETLIKSNHCVYK